MSGVYCYIQRAGAGATIRGLRLADRRQVREWTPGAASGPEGEAQTILAAARWIAEQMTQAAAGSTKKRSLTLCLDLDGGRCAWLSTPSAEHEVVKAAARNAAIASGDETSAGPGLGVVWSSEYGEPGTDLSVQELADHGPASANGGGVLSRAKALTPGHKERLAVLAVPDVSVRVLLDELDRLGIEVAGVTTLWHALAAVWDPSRADSLAGGVLERNGAHNAVASSEPATAIVALEPGGRLVWVWTRDGQLLAAGSQRLRLLEVARGTARSPAAEDPVIVARRIGEEATPTHARLLEISRADTGRVVSEWLAWSAQLGVAPSRVVCVGPAELVATGLNDSTGLASVGQSLAAGWPGSAATAVEEDDPVGATMTRLAGAEEGGGEEELDAGGRVMMVDLSSRPGRLSRTMHWWLAAAGVAAAAALGMLAWKLDQGAARTLRAAAAETGARAELYERVEASFPRLATDADPGRTLQVGLNELRKGRDDAAPEWPVADVLDRLVAAATGISDLKVKKLSISSMTNVSVDFAVPDSRPGAELLQALRALGPLADGTVMTWNGDTATSTVQVVGVSEPMRLYKLRGQWPERKTGARPAGAAPAKVDAPASTPPAATPVKEGS